MKSVISDQHAGLVSAMRRCFQGAAHQRCRVHFASNLLASAQGPTRQQDITEPESQASVGDHQLGFLAVKIGVILT